MESAGASDLSMRSAVITGPGEDSEDSGRLLKPDVPGMDEVDLAQNEDSQGGADLGTREHIAAHQDIAGRSAAIQSANGRFDDIMLAFMQGGKKVTAAEIGTIYHKIMEKLDFSRAGSEGYTYIAKRTAELVNAGFFTEDEVKSVDLGKIGDFFRTDLGKRCIAASEASMLYKEQTFESKIDINGENVLVQGVIDCWFEENGVGVLIDYKTNRIDRSKSIGEEKDRLREMYRMQLDMYADAIEKATGRKVTEKYLYLFAIGEAVPVE